MGVRGVICELATLSSSIRLVFVFHDLRFEVLARKRNQITSIRVTPQGPAAAKARPAKSEAAGSA